MTLGDSGPWFSVAGAGSLRALPPQGASPMLMSSWLEHPGLSAVQPLPQRPHESSKEERKGSVSSRGQIACLPSRVPPREPTVEPSQQSGRHKPSFSSSQEQSTADGSGDWFPQSALGVRSLHSAADTYPVDQRGGFPSGTLSSRNSVRQELRCCSILRSRAAPSR